MWLHQIAVPKNVGSTFDVYSIVPKHAILPTCYRRISGETATDPRIMR